MNEELKKRFLDKKLVGQVLKDLRERHGHHDLKAFQQKSGLAGLPRNEDGTQFPGWKTQVEYCSALGINMSDLMNEFEYQYVKKPSASGRPPRNKHEQELHDCMQEILEEAGEPATEVLRQTIMIWYRDLLTNRRPRRR